MSDFDSDIKEVSERLKEWSDDNAILESDFAAIDDLIRRHSDERGKLLEELVELLKRDKDLTSRWQSICDKGLDLHERLNSEIAKRVENGFRGLGMSDFYEGEKKVWQAIRSGTIATIAEILWQLGDSDEELTKQLEEDLKKAREDGKVADELVRRSFGEFREVVRNLTTDALQEGTTKVVSAIPFIGEKLAPKAAALVQRFTGGSAETRELAKRKRAHKDVLTDNIAKIDKVKDQLGDDNIRNTCQKGCEIANSLRGIGSTGDYRAEDWESFGKACCEALKDHADPAIEKAKQLYQTVRPALMEGVTNAFATLASDKSSLDTFKGELNDDIQKLYDALRQDDEVINALKGGEAKRRAVDELKEIKDKVTEAIKELQDTIKEAEETMKTG